MPVVIPVYFDYASSLCFIASVIGSQLEADLDIRLEWRPVEIASHHPSWRAGALIPADVRANILRVASETGVALDPPLRWLDSRAAALGACFARDHRMFPAYHQRVFAAAFREGRDIGDPNVLDDLAVAAGLPRADFATALQKGTYAGALEASLAEARALGVTGYPTFFLGEFPLSGIQPLPTMRLLFQRYLDRQVTRLVH